MSDATVRRVLFVEVGTAGTTARVGWTEGQDWRTEAVDLGARPLLPLLVADGPAPSSSVGATNGKPFVFGDDQLRRTGWLQPGQLCHDPVHDATAPAIVVGGSSIDTADLVGHVVERVLRRCSAPGAEVGEVVLVHHGASAAARDRLRRGARSVLPGGCLLSTLDAAWLSRELVDGAAGEQAGALHPALWVDVGASWTRALLLPGPGHRPHRPAGATVAFGGVDLDATALWLVARMSSLSGDLGWSDDGADQVPVAHVDAVRSAREQLSRAARAEVRLGEGLPPVSLTAGEVDDAAHPLVRRALLAAIEACGVRDGEVPGVGRLRSAWLVGGAAHMPVVPTLMRSILGCPVDVADREGTRWPDLVLARGRGDWARETDLDHDAAVAHVAQAFASGDRWEAAVWRVVARCVGGVGAPAGAAPATAVSGLPAELLVRLDGLVRERAGESLRRGLGALHPGAGRGAGGLRPALMARLREVGL